MVKNLTKATAVGLLGIGMMLAAQSAVAQSIAFIANTGTGEFGTADQNIMDALSTEGLVIGGKAIAGLGYTINVYDHNSEPDPITEDLIFISQTVSSGNVRRYTTGTVPIINTEAALNDDSGNPCDMYFSNTQTGRTGRRVVNITDNTHPITQAFLVAPYRLFNSTSAQLGLMTSTLGGGVRSLAVDAAATGDDCLAVVDTGGTPLRGGAPAGSDPAPARRVCLGLHQGAMIDPTVAGVVLLQRTVQWAIGDPVTVAMPGYAEITRDLGGTGATGATFTPGAAFNYDLVLNAVVGSDDFWCTETVPAGFTINSVSAPLGTATFSTQTVFWSGTYLTTGVTRCTVSLTAPAAGAQSSYEWSGEGGSSGLITSFYKHGARWDDAPEGYWANEPGAAPTASGLPLIDADFENTAQPGQTQYIDKGAVGLSPEDVFILRGTGNQFWNQGDDYHFTYALVRGDFDIRARVRLHPPGPYQETRLGVFARNMTVNNPNPALTGGVIWNKNNFGIAQIRRHSDGDNIARSERVENEVRPYGDVYMRLVRQGSDTRFWFNRQPDLYTTLTEPVAGGNVYFTTVTLNSVVALGIGGCASEEDGGNQGYFEAEYTSVSVPVATLYTPPITNATRSVPVALGLPGDVVTVTINLPYQADATTVTVVENVPIGNGGAVTNVSNGGVVSGDTITWTLAPYNNTVGNLTYQIVLQHQAYVPYRWAGASWEDADGYGEMIPDTTLAQQGVVALFQEGVFPDASYAGCEDNHIIENTPASNQGAWNHAEEGDWFGTQEGRDGLQDHKKILVKFDLSSLAPSSSTAFSRATVGLFFDEQRRGGIAHEAHTLTAWPVLKQWTEGTGNGSDGPAALAGESCWTSNVVGTEAWELPGAMGNTDVGAAEGSAYWDAVLNQWVTLDVTASVQSMIATAGAADDQGWKVCQDKLRGVADATVGNEYVRGAYDAASAQNGDPNRRPVLALLDSTAYAPSIASISRTVPATYTWGTATAITLNVVWAANALPIQVVEDLPAGLDATNVSNISNGGAVSGNQIVWDIASFTTNLALTYDLTISETNIAATNYTLYPVVIPGATATDSAGSGVSTGASAMKHAGVTILQNGVLPDDTYAGCQDTFILTFQKDNNAGGSDVMEEGDWRGRQDGNGLDDHKKPLIQFDLSGVTIPGGETYQSATLWLYMINQRRGDASTGGDMYNPNNANLAPWEHAGNQDHALFVWRIGKAWNEGRGTGTDGGAAQADEVTWNNANVGTVAWETPGAMGTSDVGSAYETFTWVEMPTTDTQTIGIWVPFDVSVSVGEFLAATATNNGWKICQDDASGIADDDASNVYEMGAYQFVTSEHGSASLRPYLEIRTNAAVPVEVSKFIVW